MRVIILLADNDHLWPERAPAPADFLPSSKEILWIPNLCFGSVICCFARHYCYSLVLFSWMPWFLWTLHTSSCSLVGAPSTVTQVRLLLHYWLLCVLSSPAFFLDLLSTQVMKGLSHSMEEAEESVFPFMLNIISWVTKAGSLDRNVSPSLIKQCLASLLIIFSSQGPVSRSGK